MVAPFVYLVISHPESVGQFFAYQGEKGKRRFDLGRRCWLQECACR